MQHKNSPAPPPLTDVVDRTPTLTTAHVLFLDVTGFGQLRGNQQVAAQVELSRMVQSLPEVVSARSGPEMFLCRPTGDGMALLFFKDLLSPIRCALQLHSRLQADADRILQEVGVPIQLRMGIHSGPVTLVEDINAQADAAGDGIITAQRVMDMGDTNHILLSWDVARVLLKIDPWPRYLTDLGPVRVKHRQVVHLFNLYGRLDGPFCGNPGAPRRVLEDGKARNREARALRGTLIDRLRPFRRAITTALIVGGLGAGAFYYYDTHTPAVQAFIHAIQERLQPRSAEARPNPTRSKPTPSRPTKGKGNNPVLSPVPVDRVDVPRLTSAFLDTATSIADSRGLILRERGVRTYQKDVPEGMVYQQAPAPGTRVPEGSVVVVRVSAGPPDFVPEPTPEPTNSAGG
jgi:class 3 adenylate cyclase